VFLPETADIRSSDWIVPAFDDPGLAPDYEASGMDSCSEAREWGQTLCDSLERESREPATVRVNIVIDTVPVQLHQGILRIPGIHIARSRGPDGFDAVYTGLQPASPRDR
jgi:hypothetical protein